MPFQNENYLSKDQGAYMAMGVYFLANLTRPNKKKLPRREK